jgi:type I restriction enzyme, S subunit
VSQLETALGPVPNRWAVAPLRHCVELRNDRTRNDSDLGPLIGLEHVESWTGRLVSRPEDVETAGQHLLFRRDDVLFGKLRPYLAKAHRAQHDGACSAELLVLRPRAIDAGFLTYCLLCPTWVLLIASSTFGSKMPRANWEFIGHQVLPVPSMHEQRAIADFLDRETEKIDALVAKKQRLIELLQEKRTALISHAVTKGLDRDTPMKDSGIEWFGRIPAQWPVVRLGHFARVQNGSTPSRDDAAYWLDGTVPWLASTKVNEDRVMSPSELITETALRECSLSLVPAGSVIIGLVGQGRTRGMAALLDIEATINQNMAAIIPRRQIVGRYLQYQLESMYVPIRECGRGANQAALNCELVADLRLPCPPPQEQAAIARFLDEKTDAIRALVDKTHSSIDLLGESRAALITAAVTGQIDVRTYGREAS